MQEPFETTGQNLDQQSQPQPRPEQPQPQPNQMQTVPKPTIAFVRDPSATGPMNVQEIASALAMNQAYAAEASAQQQAQRRRARRTTRWFALAAGVAAVAVVGLLGYMTMLTDAVAQITDDRVKQDLLSNEAFAQGSASDAFVQPAAYQVSSIDVTGKDVEGDDVVVKADVRLENGYFREERKVTVRYAPDGDDWAETIGVDSHSVTPLRGIESDAEYGITADQASFDAEAQTCVAGLDVSGRATDTWFMTTSGTEYVTYAFQDDAWVRTGVDDSQLYRSFQNLAGTYSAAGSQGSFWTASSRQGKLQSITVNWVDDDTGAFTGTFSWTSGSSRYFSASSATGEFTGYIDETGYVVAESDGSAGTIAFEGAADDSGGFTLDYRVYYEDGVESFFGGSSVYESSGTATLASGQSSPGWGGFDFGDASGYDEPVDSGDADGLGDAGDGFSGGAESDGTDGSRGDRDFSDAFDFGFGTFGRSALAA